ncbi:MAG: ABC transporter ATP-binding protein [Actinomycetota bacterium]|nr:ABC transporter ATP-binding protein [Actinomycetota bacterium]
MTINVDEQQRDRPTEGALSILRRGIAVTPKLKRGLAFTVGVAALSAIGKLAIPLLIRVASDRGLQPGEEARPGFVVAACLVTAGLTIVVFLLSRRAFLRLILLTEGTLFDLRLRTFEHVHRLSIAEHNESRRGVIVARVTSDVEQLGKFFEWGGMSWIINSTLLVGTVVVMLFVSWQLTIVTLVSFIGLLPLLRWIQVRQLVAYSALRTRVGETIGEFSEAIGGAQVIRAYGLENRSTQRLDDAIDRQYSARMRAVRFFAVLFTLGDVFGAIALSAVITASVWQADEWGLELGQVLAFVFLVTLMAGPVGELSEILDQTQIALAGWEKILAVLDTPVEIIEPDDGTVLAAGAISLEADGVGFEYRDGGPVLVDVNVCIEAGTKVAVVGETGSGKTTFAKLLVRLADPVAGSLRVNGSDLRRLAPDSRRHAIRMVPQDGFLFDTSLRTNISYGRPGVGDREIAEAVTQLGLDAWVASLPDGLDTEAGERGEALSVGERQLVALIRAQVADPGLLILDEATSSVDPRTEQALATALDRLAEGRTTVSIAHRLSTAEQADLVLVFDQGRLVEQGSHLQLVASGGVYAGLYDSWVGNTRTAG